MSRTPEQVRSDAKARTQAARKRTAAVLVEVLAESGTTVTDVARMVGASESLAHKWCSGEVAVPAYLLHDERLPAGLRERLAQRLLGVRRATSGPSTLRVVHVAAETIAALTTSENDNARPVVAELHDELSRWLCAREAA